MINRGIWRSTIHINKLSPTTGFICIESPIKYECPLDIHRFSHYLICEDPTYLPPASKDHLWRQCRRWRGRSVGLGQHSLGSAAAEAVNSRQTSKSFDTLPKRVSARQARLECPPRKTPLLTSTYMQWRSCFMCTIKTVKYNKNVDYLAIDFQRWGDPDWLKPLVRNYCVDKEISSLPLEAAKLSSSSRQLARLLAVSETLTLNHKSLNNKYDGKLEFET